MSNTAGSKLDLMGRQTYLWEQRSLQFQPKVSPGCKGCFLASGLSSQDSGKRAWLGPAAAALSRVTACPRIPYPSC